MIRVLFRVDASVAIGSGHVMRCLALAERLAGETPAGKRAELAFLCADLPGNLIARIAERGFKTLTLPEAEAASPEAALRRLDGLTFDWLAVDHYGLDARWESAMRAVAKKILVIDDLADRPHDCDWLLDQNYFRSFADRYAHLSPPHCARLTGPAYALLRPGFRRKDTEIASPEKPRLLICFGGSDPNGETFKALEAVRLLGEDAPAVDVAVGSGNPHKEAIETLCREMSADFHCQTEDMAGLMHRATIAVGSGGTITWERLCAGLPAIVLAIAENQVDISRNLAEDGYLIYLGRSEAVSVARLAWQIAALLENPPLRDFLSRRGQALVDGLGAERVARVLCPPELTLRRAEMSDCEPLLEWRNHEVNRRFSLDAAPIDGEIHRAWLARTLASPDHALLIGEIDGGAIGVLRYDLDHESATVSVYLVPGMHGRGLGTALLEAGGRWLAQHAPQVRAIEATILEGNTASREAFIKAGYVGYSRTFRKSLSPVPDLILPFPHEKMRRS